MEINREELSLAIDTEITKLFYLSLLINRYSKRRVDLRLNGYIDNLEISVYEGKSLRSGFKSIDAEFNYSNSEEYEWYKDSKERLRYIQSKVEFLEEICKTDKIPYNWCNPVKDIVSYEF